jgi:hypothetical protein
MEIRKAKVNPDLVGKNDKAKCKNFGVGTRLTPSPLSLDGGAGEGETGQNFLALLEQRC